MTHRLFAFTLLCAAAMFGTGCATVFKGYESTVNIYEAPIGIRVFDSEGIEYPIHFGTYMKEVRINGTSETVLREEPNVADKYVLLRSNKEHYVTITYLNTEYRHYIYPKIDPFWFVVDILCGGFPVFVDAYTGSWNRFEPIIFNNLQRSTPPKKINVE